MSQNRGRDQSYIVRTFRNDSARYNEHDDRGGVLSREQRYRQANFKSRGRFLRGRARYQPPSLDDDANMAARRQPHMQYGNERRRGMRGRARPVRGAPRGGRGSTAAYSSTAKNSVNAQLGSWFKVTVKNGFQLGRDFVVATLNENLSEPYAPIGYHKETNGRDVSFYVENKQTADSFTALDQRIATPNGYKLRIQSRRSEPPVPTVDDSTKSELQVALSNRYSPENKTLNLASFQTDATLRSKGLYMPLWYQRVMAAITDIIVEHIPEVRGVNLSRNRVLHLGAFKPLKEACKDLQALDISHNQLNTIGLLDVLSGLPLVELNLDGNRLCDSFNDKADYISAVRKRFPKVVLLDGVQLPPPIEFDVDNDAVAASKLPDAKSCYFCGTQPRDVALKFLEKYFEVFDADKRDELINAYHEQCRFSLAVCLPPRGNTENRMHNTWMQDSRNLLRVSRDRQGSLLRAGKLEVLGALARLPKTEHDKNSLRIDVPVANEHLMQVSISGVFREREERHTPVRAFSRVFIIIPHGVGCIVNEMFTITVATSEQIKAAFKPAAPTPSPSPVPHVQPVPAAAAAAASPQLTDQLRISMAQQLAAVSGMNINWSGKCLEENGFNYDAALQAFNALNATGKVPPEAFLRA